MFTGIIEGAREVAALARQGERARLTIALCDLAEGVHLGESIAVGGVCLTVAGISGDQARFDVIQETLERSTLGVLRPGTRVNIERAMKAGARFDGHFVQGHVDGVASVIECRREPGQTVLTCAIPEGLETQFVPKGSVAIDGVSLTIAALERERFSVCLIPHTLKLTTLGSLQAGDRVNIETDVIGKYVARFFSVMGQEPRLTWQRLAEWGYAYLGESFEGPR